MKEKLFKSDRMNFFIIPSLFFFLFVFFYSQALKTIPVSFWDEILWVGQSYFIQPYIHGDFQNKIWLSPNSYDQPKLAEYAYGMWLYPLYLKEKYQRKEDEFDYTRFLISKGFYEIDERYMDSYKDYEKMSSPTKFDERDSGFPQEWVGKYGHSVVKTINIIYYARIMNIFLLAGASLAAYFLVLQYAGLLPAFVFLVFYGFNSLIVDAGLKAHSEALFLFTFNCSLLLMNLYFTKGRKLHFLLLFSVFSGLTIATKLNGVMLIPVFFLVNTVLFFVTKEKKNWQLFQPVLSAVISVILFISLNPFTFSDPFKNVQYMFTWRVNQALYQVDIFFEAYLPDNFVRIKKVFENFYSPASITHFNSPKFVSFSTEKYWFIVVILFLIGFLYSVKLACKKDKSAILLLSSFLLILISMSYYLLLNWSRYYVHLVLYFVLFQSLGLSLALKYFYIYLKLLWRYVKR